MKRALESDVAARAADLNQLIAILLLRQGALIRAIDNTGSIHKDIIHAARDSAVDELKFRFVERFNPTEAR